MSKNCMDLDQLIKQSQSTNREQRQEGKYSIIFSNVELFHLGERALTGIKLDNISTPALLEYITTL